MLLNVAEVSLITSALRAMATIYEQRAKEAQAVFNKRDAANFASYASACAALAAKVESKGRH